MFSLDTFNNTSHHGSSDSYIGYFYSPYRTWWGTYDSTTNDDLNRVPDWLFTIGNNLRDSKQGWVANHQVPQPTQIPDYDPTRHEF